jgi:hypothetical protein
LSALLIALFYLGWKLGGLPFVPFDLFDWITRELPGSIVTVGIDSVVALLRAANIGSTGAAAKAVEQAMAVGAFVAAAVVAGAALFGLLRESEEPARLLGAIVGGMLGGSTFLVERDLRRIESGAGVDLLWLLGTFLTCGLAFGWAYEREASAAALDRASHRGSRHPPWIPDSRGPGCWPPALLTAAWSLMSGRRCCGGARHPTTTVAECQRHRDTSPARGGVYAARDRTVDADTGTPVIDRSMAAENRWPRRRSRGLTLEDLRREVFQQFVTLLIQSVATSSEQRDGAASAQRLLRRFRLRPGATHLRIISADGFRSGAAQTIGNDPRVMLTYAWDGCRF